MFKRLKRLGLRPLQILLARTYPMSEIEQLVTRKMAQNAQFTFNYQLLNYFFHSYNNFGLSERSIEVPIIQSYLEQQRYQNVLEIGNVSNHYYDQFRRLLQNRVVVDRYEVGFDVLNLDIGEYRSEQLFDFAFSISTFEHMDSDLGRNPNHQKGMSRLVSVAADNIGHVSTLLKPGARFVLTAPLCYTPEWKETFYSGVFADCGFSAHRCFLFRRTGELTWSQINTEDGRNAPFDSRLPHRNYLSVVEFTK